MIRRSSRMTSRQAGSTRRTEERVAKRIQETNRQQHGTTSIVVTHDVAGLVSYVDRVLLIDPASRRVEEVACDHAVAPLIMIEQHSTCADADFARPRAGAVAKRFLAATTSSVEALVIALGHLVPRWRSPRWGMRFFLGYLRLFAGPSALVYFGLSGFVIGFVATYFTLHFLPYREFTEGLILDDLIGALGFGLYRILAPLIIAILMAARGGGGSCRRRGGACRESPDGGDERSLGCAAALPAHRCRVGGLDRDPDHRDRRVPDGARGQRLLICNAPGERFRALL